MAPAIARDAQKLAELLQASAPATSASIARFRALWRRLQRLFAGVNIMGVHNDEELDLLLILEALKVSLPDLSEDVDTIQVNEGRAETISHVAKQLHEYVNRKHHQTKGKKKRTE
jgi:hypothetical protein